MNRLKELREERGLTVRSLESLIGINHSTITTYENETRDLNTNALKKFASFFEVTIDYLLYYSGYFIFANYHDLMFKVNEDDYKKLYKDGFIYFNDGKRWVNLNKLVGLDNDNDLSGLIVDLYKVKRFDRLFNDGDLSVLDNQDVEIVLDVEFVEYVKKAIEC